ncbi:hypothetical protein [Haloferax sp. Q22]|uniref:hypothetical protein n=1 Tax=Haloferax sp. (strain Q22) TaxID=1526048 RepID=UPI0012FAE411|nr:hypothetical protein [Haloferax sp. Q22]
MTEVKTTAQTPPEPIETVFQGSGSVLKEFQTEREGPVLFDIELEDSSGVEIVVINEEGERETTLQRPGGRRDWTSAELLRDIEPGNYALDVSSDSAWSVEMDQYPVLEQSTVDPPELPLEFDGDSPAVFGPYYLEGFYSVTSLSEELMAVQFHNASGEQLESLRHSSRFTAEGEEVEHDPINIEGVCWISCVGIEDYSVTVEGAN